MASVQRVHLDGLEITAVGSGTSKDEVVLASHDQCWRLILAKERLELRIRRDICLVIVHQVYLNVAVTGAIQSDLVECQVVGSSKGSLKRNLSTTELSDNPLCSL